MKDWKETWRSEKKEEVDKCGDASISLSIRVDSPQAQDVSKEYLAFHDEGIKNRRSWHVAILMQDWNVSQRCFFKTETDISLTRLTEWPDWFQSVE
jgi:hypothetical protein